MLRNIYFIVILAVFLAIICLGVARRRRVRADEADHQCQWCEQSPSLREATRARTAAPAQTALSVAL
jgi:hypothetical protein